MIYIEEQLTLIRHLQEWRGPIFDAVLRGFNFLDTFAYYSSLVAFIWVGVSWRWGVRLGFLFVISGMINTLAKLAFALPRPLVFDSSLGIVKLSGYGFPSGGAQMSMLLAVILIYYWKNRWAWTVGGAYVALVSLSRIALGVHFVVDVLGGWVIAWGIAALFIRYVRPIETFASSHANSLFISIVLFTLLGFVFFPVKVQFLLAITFVFALGVFLSTKWGLYISGKRVLGKQILHGLVGIMGAFLLGHAVMPYFPGAPHFAEGIAGGIWVTLLASPFCKKVLK